MIKTTEHEWMLTSMTGQKIARGEQEWLDKYFPLVEASQLSINDEFLQHEPETRNQNGFKRVLIKAINSGLTDFRAQAIDPSFDKEGKICYVPRMMPAVGKSAKWWYKNAPNFLPEKNSRQGLTKERIAFLGLLIKNLVEEHGYTISNAWRAICDLSKDLGHYLDSKGAKGELEPTGSRKVGKWYDLANTFKITVDDEKASGFSLVGGNFDNHCDYYHLACVRNVNSPNIVYYGSVGWLVLDV